MLQWRNTRLAAVLAVLTALAASFGSWGWELFRSWS
jgi:ABC-type multidrug transport system permease subunit